MKRLHKVRPQTARPPASHAVSQPAGQPRQPFPIVGIGASAGGLEAFTQLLQHLPPDTGMAFVLVQHLDPDHESALSGLLARITALPVHEVTNKLRVEPNHVYVIPPNADMALAQGILRLLPRKPARGAHRSIDVFFESLARDQHGQALGVVLSGTASDGTQGLEAIKAEGGITFAQDDSAKYDSMPRSAIAAGCVDFVLSPEKIASELARLARHPWVKGAPMPPPRTSTGETGPEPGAPPGAELALPRGGRAGRPDREEIALRKILQLLRHHSGVDFSLYKPTTIQRRISRRMVLNKSESLDAYAGFLRGNAPELEALYSDLLINVTSFFRNPEAFAALQAKVFPKLFQRRRSPGEPVRLWVLGCSTGQEAYSLAMAGLEFCDTLSPPPPLQVFATDLNEVLLEKARHGLYPKSLLQEVSPERLRRFFVEEQGGYRVTKALRQVCVFARQNLLSDPPFSRMDLISCRNLLIYLEPASQHKILPAFHYALKPEGFLFLGASESIGPFTDLFEAVDKKLKIFSRKPGATPGLHLPPSRSQPAGKKTHPPSPPSPPQAPVNELGAQREADRLTVARFAPPGVLVNASLQILQFRGPTGPFLQPPTGKPTADLLKMARPELMLPLRAALKKAQQLNRLVRTEHVLLDHTGPARSVNLEIVPLKNLKERCYLIFFEEAAGQQAGRAGPGAAPLEPPSAGPQAARPPGGSAPARRVAELERELAETRDYLQSLQEQYEAAHEELQAANEEVTSANEELQSINEELETSKEELESTNEELTTVNEEMAHRNQELNRLNSDLNNLHVSLNMPILLLGRDLTIRQFTPQAEKLFNLLAADIGRPLAGIKHNLACPDLEAFITQALDHLRVCECEVQDKEGTWFVLRVRPYLTLDNRIDGAVLLLVDITALKQKEQEISRTRNFAHALIDSVPPLLVLDPSLRVQTANKSFYHAFGVSPPQTEQRLIYELGNGQWNIPALRQLLEEILPRKHSLQDYEVTHEFESIGRRTMLLNARQIDRAQTIILSFADITERKHAEELLRQAKDALATHAADLERAVTERTASLRETVRELEAFSYSMVHDMRAPLRAMNSFAHLLHEHYGSQLDDEGRQMLQRIFGSAERLDQLIQDVLNYTHVLRDQAPLTPVDLDELMRELLATYPDWTPRAEIQVVGRLPLVLGHKALLAQCLSNLVGNAIKFVAPGVQPRVRIWADPRDGQVRINVQDNGIGITPAQGERVFGMFQRINPASDYEGTGIGLTIVRRAAERMGGQVGFDSQPGKGSTFWLELARAEKR